MFLTNGMVRYEVGDPVARGKAFNLYLCREAATNRICLLQVAPDVIGNGLLQRSAYVLGQLRNMSDELEAYGRLGPFHYERLFPQLIDSFVSEEQGNRLINILAFADIDDATLMVPLSGLRRADQRVDLETSAWILGRLLKLLDWIHPMGISVHDLSTRNVLISPADHFTVVFDWSHSISFHGEFVPREYCREDIVQAVSTAFTIIGGDPTTRSYDYEVNAAGRRYVEHLRSILGSRPHNAEQTHRQFYAMVREQFGKSFHPFTPLPL